MTRRIDLSSPRQAYTVGLALIALLVTLQFFGANVAVNRQEVSSLQINLAGRQRMLSQRIAWSMSQLVASPDGSADAARLRGLIGVCVDLMERSHLALVARELGPMQAVLAAGEPCLVPQPGANIPLPAERVGLSESSDLASFTHFAWSVATGETSAAEKREFLSSFEAPLSELLAQLDRDTLDAQQASTQQLETLLSINWILILLLVLGELMLIFRPMARAVERSFRRLRDANRRLAQSETRLQDFA
ncbi:MAG: type IV pili methyl-accepting chemotaxis transducer N-terminal domain-containing protein, partial [Pseudomonadota bacterium]